MDWHLLSGAGGGVAGPPKGMLPSRRQSCLSSSWSSTHPGSSFVCMAVPRLALCWPEARVGCLFSGPSGMCLGVGASHPLFTSLHCKNRSLIPTLCFLFNHHIFEPAQKHPLSWNENLKSLTFLLLQYPRLQYYVRHTTCRKHTIYFKTMMHQY